MSGRKDALLQKKITSAGDASLTSVTSSVVNIQFMDNIGVQTNILTGTPTGTFTVEVSADYSQDVQGNVVNTGNWVSISLPISAAVASGSPANIYLDLNQISAPWLRVKYTKTSGTGTFDVWITAKMI